ncbi:ThuA domain-containing protein [Segetibacter sp.]|jgi:type 1 glutamine amidotransferase|uniref:ThuA domain-containing protein n=1 Tax=Segetibacter sp. TaxID=2231182 RepID=UPI00260257E8|nr:ThuA domain-containing protein [Segetibacter sp.]MCW3081216.1 signal peptide and transrane prediction [Segetibacter sp.]
MKKLRATTGCFLLCFLLAASFCSCAQNRKNASAKKPTIIFVTGDHEYSGEATLPLVAAELEKNYGFQTKFLKAFPDHNSEENIPGLEALKEADVAVFFLRWRRLPANQVKYIEDYLKTGKPVVGFRTTTHAFNYPKGHELEKWNSFGELVFNAPPGWGGKANHTHYGHKSTTDVTIIPEASKNPILTGVGNNFHASSWLYKVLPDYPAKGSTWLLTGHPINPDKKDATDQPVAWTGKNSYGAKFFITTLGHPEDFSQEPFQRLVINAIHWAAGKPIPKKWAGKMDISVPYRQ